MFVRIPLHCRWAAQRVLLILAALTLLLSVASTASAHAVLRGTEPADGALTKAVPTKVVMTFNENVHSAFGGIKIYAPDGSRVDDGKASVTDGTVTAKVGEDGAPGTYAVSYRVVSADGHPIRGAFTFDVKEKSGTGVSLAKAQASSEGDLPLEITLGVSRGLILFSLLFVAGGAIFAFVIAPGTDPWRLRTFLLVAIVLLPLAFLLDAAIAAGFSLTEVLRISVLQEETTSTYGRAAVIQWVLAIVALIWRSRVDTTKVRSTANGIVVSAVFVLPLLAVSLGGHAIATSPVWLRLPFDMVHVTCAAIWLGGLVQLGHRLNGPPISAVQIERWSRVALVAVILIVITGSYAAWTEITFSWHGLISTTYGRLVIAKYALLFAAMPLAAVNRQQNVPAIKAAIDQGAAGEARKRLKVFVIWEIALLVFVVAATAWLIQSQPARTLEAPGLIDATITLPSKSTVNMIIDPARAGRNEIHLYTLDKQGAPDQTSTDMTMEIENTKLDIGPLHAKLLLTGAGHWTVPEFVIPQPGTWTVRVGVQHGQFDEERGVKKVTISAAGS